jgi:hypothetical protein
VSKVFSAGFTGDYFRPPFIEDYNDISVVYLRYIDIPVEVSFDVSIDVNIGGKFRFFLELFVVNDWVISYLAYFRSIDLFCFSLFSWMDLKFTSI